MLTLGPFLLARSMTNDLPTGTVTFLFTDIEGSTPLWEREPKQMRAALERHHSILQQSIVAHGGRVYKIVGDAFQAAFDVSGQAILAALAAQRALAAEVWPTSAPLRVRIGLHVGHALAHGTDYATTHTLNRVARIMSAGHGGQILLSEAVAELIRDDLPAGIRLRDMGKHHLKGLTQLEHLFQVIAPDLPARFPPLNSLDAASNNLPVQLTTFIGRKRELAEAKRLLASARMLTLIGPGGTGKTRLALQAGADLLASFADGVWMVELAPLADPALMEQTVAYVLGLREAPGQPLIDLIAEYLQSRSLLLILDNCEHLVEACAQLADHLLRACPQLKIIASSREALGIAGETVYRVPSLSLPKSDAAISTLMQCESVQLFMERARAAQPHFTLTDVNASSVAQICLRLDGIPLALELAAARVKMFSAEQIASRLDDRFRLLTGGSRTALPRQQTLRALIDWSYSLLTEPERILFRRLSVFIGGWPLEAAEQVCAGKGVEQLDVLDLLSRLVDKSLVITEDTAHGVRYRYLEMIRQYAREKLLESNEVEAIRDQHLTFYLQFAESGDQGLRSPRQAEWGCRLEEEHDNLRAALEWGLPRNPDSALSIAGALPNFWAPGGYAVEGHRWIRQALARVEALPPLAGDAARQRMAAQARARSGVAILIISQGDNQSGASSAEESVALYRQLEDRRGLAFALLLLAMAREFLGEGVRAETLLHESIALARSENDAVVAAWALSNLARVTASVRGDFEAARHDAEESIRISREAGLHWQAAVAVQMLGTIAVYRHDYVEARARFEEVIPLLQELGARFNVTLAKSDLAHLERNHGNLRRALELYRETIVAFEAVGQRGAVAHQLECFAFIASAQEKFERAARLLAAAEILREKAGIPMTPHERPEYDKQVSGVHDGMDESAFAAAWSAGRAMTMKQAIDYAVKVDSGMWA